MESFAREDMKYRLQLQEDKITSCTCPAHSESGLTCKHMFLAFRITHYAIYIPNVILPNRRAREPEENDTLEDQRAHKHRLVEKIQEGISTLERADYWHCAKADVSLDPISRASLTRVLSAVDSLRHLTRDTFLVCPQNATQW